MAFPQEIPTIDCHVPNNLQPALRSRPVVAFASKVVFLKVATS
jgi:hypothetical protein